jgi:hypothetical protein
MALVVFCLGHLFAVGVFAAPQVLRYFRRPSTLRSRQARSRRVTQLRRFRVCTRSTQHDRVLLCHTAFAACTAVLLTAVLLTAVLTRSLKRLTARGLGPLSAGPAYTRRRPRSRLTTSLLRTRRWHRELRRSPPRGGPVRVHVRIPCFV